MGLSVEQHSDSKGKQGSLRLSSTSLRASSMSSLLGSMAPSFQPVVINQISKDFLGVITIRLKTFNGLLAGNKNTFQLANPFRCHISRAKADNRGQIVARIIV